MDQKFHGKKQLTHKKTERISSAQKSNMSNPFLIYDFYNQLESVSHLHPFMNKLKLITNVSKLFKLIYLIRSIMKLINLQFCECR